MAILGWLLGQLDLGVAAPVEPPVLHPVPDGPNPCPNPSCVSRTEARHVVPQVRLKGRAPLRAACGYCTRAIAFEFVGCSSTGVYHAPGAKAVRQIHPQHLVFLPDEGAAGALGFRASGSL